MDKSDIEYLNFYFLSTWVAALSLPYATTKELVLTLLVSSKGDDEGWLMSPSEFVPNIADGTEQFKSKKKNYDLWFDHCSKNKKTLVKHFQYA